MMQNNLELVAGLVSMTALVAYLKIFVYRHAIQKGFEAGVQFTLVKIQEHLLGDVEESDEK